MKTTNEVQEQFAQFTGKSVDALALWADATQRTLRELVDFSASTAKEGVKLYAELQSSAVEAVKEGQGYWLRRQSELGEFQKDPLGWYQKSLVGGIEETQKAFKLVEANAQAITRSAERLQVTAEQVAKEIQQTFVTLGSKVKTLYTLSSN